MSRVMHACNWQVPKRTPAAAAAATAAKDTADSKDVKGVTEQKYTSGLGKSASASAGASASTGEITVCPSGGLHQQAALRQLAFAAQYEQSRHQQLPQPAAGSGPTSTQSSATPLWGGVPSSQRQQHAQRTTTTGGSDSSKRRWPLTQSSDLPKEDDDMDDDGGQEEAPVDTENDADSVDDDTRTDGAVAGVQCSVDDLAVQCGAAHVAVMAKLAEILSAIGRSPAKTSKQTSIKPAQDA